MPRRKLARRFEPRYGVSQVALDIESKYVGRELEDRLLQSTNDLRSKLVELQTLISTAEQELAAKVAAMGDRERLAIRSMFARDCWHMAKLYLTFLNSARMPETISSTRLAPQEVDENDEPAPLLSFKETLFG